jgi:hypothetical protein
MAILLEVFRDPANIIAPGILPILLDILKIELDKDVEIDGMHSDKPIGPLTASESDAPVNGGRQDETVVIIGVLADKVHAPRGTNHDLRCRAESPLKQLCNHGNSSLYKKAVGRKQKAENRKCSDTMCGLIHPISMCLLSIPR